LPALRLSKHGGSIINLVDINAQAPLKNFSVYCGAKAALAMLTKAIAVEEAQHGVRCNSISPGKRDA
jgi:pteridine reductase